MLLFLALLITPLIEIALFIVVGDAIGLWATLGLVVVTAIIGGIALRNQGLSTLRKLQSLGAVEETPLVLVEGLLLGAAGLLLLTPGVLTDAIGFLMLIPPVRRIVAKRIAEKAVVAMSGQAGPARGADTASPGHGPRPAGGGDDSEPEVRGPAPEAGRARSKAAGPDAPGVQSPFRRRGRVVSAEDAEVVPQDAPHSRGDI